MLTSSAAAQLTAGHRKSLTRPPRIPATARPSDLKQQNQQQQEVDRQQDDDDGMHVSTIFAQPPTVAVPDIARSAVTSGIAVTASPDIHSRNTRVADTSSSLYSRIRVR